jgi:hypothetical protein
MSERIIAFRPTRMHRGWTAADSIRMSCIDGASRSQRDQTNKQPQTRLGIGVGVSTFTSGAVRRAASRSFGVVSSDESVPDARGCWWSLSIRPSTQQSTQ